MRRYHNKKRNSALLYEFLIRHISKCIVENNKEEANKAMSLSKKYFCKGSVLNDELKFYKSILETKVSSRHSAQKIINEVFSSNSRVNARKLDAEKSRLIKEINYTLRSDGFYDYKIPNYTVYASIHTLLSEGRKRKKTLKTVDKIKLEDTILEHLVREVENSPIDNLKVNPAYNNTIYKFVIQRFHKKYDNKLTENQKKLLTKYAVFLISENNSVLKSAIQKEVEKIKNTLRDIKDEAVTRDSNLMERLNECYKNLVVKDFENITEDNVLEVLKYMHLAEEVLS